MPDLSTLLVAVASFLAGAFVTELVSALVTRFTAQMGRVDYVRQDCGFYAQATLEDGTSVRTLLLDPTEHFTDSPSYTLTIRGTFLNETHATKFFRRVHVDFVRPSGDRIRHQNPRLILDGAETHVLALDASSSTPITLIVDIPADSLKPLYTHALPIIVLQPQKGKELHFRGSHTSFYGRPAAYWSRRSKVPVVMDSPRSQ